VKRYLIYITTLLLAVGCAQPKPQAEGEQIYVSIAPLRALVEGIVEQDFPIEVLVPAGASPESFELSPKQLIALNGAQWLFATGLIEFETTLLARLEGQTPIVALDRGIEPIAGSCSHAHHAGHHHTHGVDPHIWTSPRALKQMSQTIYDAIHERYPDSVRYTQNFNRLQERLDSLDKAVTAHIEASDVESFIIYHPALTYYARDYGLTQEAIEQNGKEPSARQLAALIRKARAEGVRTILYQHQFPRSSVETLATDIEAQAVEFDPLAEDILAQIDSITTWITQR
jgi:zinc transport system substrate-binding protein